MTLGQMNSKLNKALETETHLDRALHCRALLEDAVDYKGTSADKKEKPEGVVMSCPFCGEAFVRRWNRTKTCGRPKCETARNTLNQRNSRKKRKIQAQQSK